MPANHLIKLSGFALLAPLALAGCSQPPYFTGDGPEISSIQPDWENGNVGGALVLGLLEDRANPTEDEIETLVSPRLVRISGDFSACAESELGIERMCADAWRWQSQNPTGYNTAAAAEAKE